MNFPCLVRFRYIDYSRHILVLNEEQFEEERHSFGCWNHEVIDWKNTPVRDFPGTCEELMILMRSEPCQK